MEEVNNIVNLLLSQRWNSGDGNSFYSLSIF